MYLTCNNKIFISMNFAVKEGGSLVALVERHFCLKSFLGKLRFTFDFPSYRKEQFIIVYFAVKEGGSLVALVERHFCLKSFLGKLRFTLIYCNRIVINGSNLPWCWSRFLHAPDLSNLPANLSSHLSIKTCCWQINISNYILTASCFLGVMMHAICLPTQWRV